MLLLPNWEWARKPLAPAGQSNAKFLCFSRLFRLQPLPTEVDQFFWASPAHFKIKSLSFASSAATSRVIFFFTDKWVYHLVSKFKSSGSGPHMSTVQTWKPELSDSTHLKHLHNSHDFEYNFSLIYFFRPGGHSRLIKNIESDLGLTSTLRFMHT